jgi:hypothetical protein
VGQQEITLEANDDVGMSLIAGEEADAIIELLKAQLGEELTVRDAVTYLKIETGVGQLEVHFAAVADLLGRSFTLSDFQTIFASYYGRPYVDDDMAGVYADMDMGITDRTGNGAPGSGAAGNGA